MDDKDLNFKASVSTLLLMEGGYSNHPYDYGGETNFGISKRQYPTLDIKNLTYDKACEIYYKDYWLKFGVNKIKDQETATQLLLMFTNMNPITATKIIQNALAKLDSSIAIDGVLGENTRKAIDKYSVHFITYLRLETVKFYYKRTTIDESQTICLKGWIKRALT